MKLTSSFSHTFLVFFLLLANTILQVPVFAQVTVNVRIDSLELFVGQQTQITLDVSMPAKSVLRLPQFAEGDTLTSGVEVVAMDPADTIGLDNGNLIQVKQVYHITSFDSAFYYLPPFKVYVDDKLYTSKNLALNVLSIPVDTVHVDRFFGPKGIMNPPFKWEDWAGIFYLSLLMSLTFLLAIYLYIRHRDNRPIVRIIKRAPKLPAHQVAMQEIDKIKAERSLLESDSKTYYTLLTTTLRTYIQERYGFNALEMTSSEIIEHLMQSKNEVAFQELKELFTTADLVKFAKYDTLVNENDRNLVYAISFINQTKIEVDPNAMSEEEEITIEEMRSKRMVYFLRFGIVFAFLISVALLVWIGWSVYQLVM